MRLSELLPRLPVLEHRGAADPHIDACTSDSRAVGQGTLFAAIPGTRVDGHRFIGPAIEAGASAVLLQRFEGDWPAHVAGLRVDDPRRSLSLAAQALAGDPARGMTVVGVTGTNGKTTTVAILRSLFTAAGWPAGSLGTTGIGWDAPGGPVHHAATHTTPDGPALWGWIRRMADDGVAALALELSSHALHQGRAAGLPLTVGAWTNLSRDHLDYHGSLQAYEAAKALLLTEWLGSSGKDGTAVLFVDDAVVARHVADHEPCWTVSLRPHSGADVRPLRSPELGLFGARARIATPRGELTLRSPMIGEHNLANALIAGACALVAGMEPAAVEAGWAACDGAPGRLQRVARDDGAGPTVLVDYAHTPDAVTHVLAALRPLCAGRLITVFGCGGDRDAGKRPTMAAAAEVGSDELILTSDNPRSEDPDTILDAMEAGLTGSVPATREVDRRRAIERALADAAPGDVVLIAGKGHETTQEIAGRKLPFDDRLVARDALLRWAP